MFEPANFATENDNPREACGVATIAACAPLGLGFIARKAYAATSGATSASGRRLRCGSEQQPVRGEPGRHAVDEPSLRETCHGGEGLGRRSQLR